MERSSSACSAARSGERLACASGGGAACATCGPADASQMSKPDVHRRCMARLRIEMVNGASLSVRRDCRPISVRHPSRRHKQALPAASTVNWMAFPALPLHLEWKGFPSRKKAPAPSRSRGPNTHTSSDYGGQFASVGHLERTGVVLVLLCEATGTTIAGTAATTPSTTSVAVLTWCNCWTATTGFTPPISVACVALVSTSRDACAGGSGGLLFPLRTLVN